MTKEELTKLNNKIEIGCGEGKKWTVKYMNMIWVDELQYWDLSRSLRALKSLFDDPNRKYVRVPSMQELKRYYESTPKLDTCDTVGAAACPRCSEGHISYKKKMQSCNVYTEEEFWVWREYAARCSCPMGQRLPSNIRNYDAINFRGAVRCDDLRDYIYGRPTDDTPEFKVLVVQETRREF